jgi:hypothetical protein
MLRNISAVCGILLAITTVASAETVSRTATSAVVPGTGTQIDFVGDQFEDPNWSFIHNHPKSSREEDEQLRYPVGKSTNGRWYEGPERGHPDLMKVVPTPAGALPGSKYCLLVQTLNSGIPGRRSFDVQQDDLIVDLANRIGNIQISETPSVTTRVYLPPADKWENRTGPHFGFRITTVATVWKTEEVKNRFRIRRPERYRAQEQYWPGIWIHFRSETDNQIDEDSAFMTVRGNNRGHDFVVRQIPQSDFGWWTLGMSVTPDGMVHFYASSGVDDLSEEDYITSQYPYSYRAQRFETMFYNFCNNNDGKTWSTPFLVDDPKLYLVNPQRVTSIVQRKKEIIARKQNTDVRQARKQKDLEKSAASSRRNNNPVARDAKPRTALRNPSAGVR